MAAATASGGGDGARCARERAGGEEEGEGECERGRGGCVASLGHPDEEGRGQAGREAGGVARGSARASGTQLLGEVEKTTEEEAGWAACWLGRPTAAGLHREEAQVSLPLLFLFSNFSDICFDLIKILNHLITLCQFCRS